MCKCDRSVLAMYCGSGDCVEPKKFYEITFTTDYNDGDYLYCTNKVDEDQLEKIKSIVAKIAAWKGGEERWPRNHNWPLCDKSWEGVAEMHGLTMDEMNFIMDYISTDPYTGECHTIDDVRFKPWIDSEVLL